MDIKSSEVNGRIYIRSFLQDYLPKSGLDPEMQHFTIELLNDKGKIYSDSENRFTWGEFSFYVYSLMENEKNLIIQTGIAAGIELLILATDIIDDLVDRDQKGAFHKILSEPNALTLSNALLMESFHLFLTYSGDEQIKKLSIIIHSLQNSCNGQWRDLSFIVGDNIPTEEQYFQLIEQKSVSLIFLIFGLCHAEQDPILQELASCIGYSGQLKNDARDILSDNSNDLIHKKATLPLIKAIEYSMEKDQGLLLHKLKQLDTNKVDLELMCELRDYIRNTGAVDYCLILAKLYINQAKVILNQCFPDKKEYTEKIIRLLD
ncbi:polyprenyl synthetase family protein [Metabacillus litoralis]|uniref:polyprenyl synthetase family protein n=1 Tax=Metabacillus litoralis TaxID=152268 RepID=UPI00203C1DFA|nr:class 1 isoprenoid biosynthesis enzyme [Metabacillus litoralis]